MAVEGGGGGGAVFSKAEYVADQGYFGSEESFLGSDLTNHLASNSVLLCGKHEGGGGGSVECSLACCGPVDEVLATSQARVAEAEG